MGVFLNLAKCMLIFLYWMVCTHAFHETFQHNIWVIAPFGLAQTHTKLLQSLKGKQQRPWDRIIAILFGIFPLDKGLQPVLYETLEEVPALVVNLRNAIEHVLLLG